MYLVITSPGHGKRQPHGELHLGAPEGEGSCYLRLGMAESDCFSPPPFEKDRRPVLVLMISVKPAVGPADIIIANTGGSSLFDIPYLTLSITLQKGAEQDRCLGIGTWQCRQRRTGFLFSPEDEEDSPTGAIKTV